MHYQISRIFVLSCTFGTDYIVLLKYIGSLTGIDGMAIRSGYGVSDILLIADSVASVMRFPVNGISHDAEHAGIFPDQRHIVAACSAPGRDRR